MKIWSVSNQKGGVGKTTTVVTLGGILSSWGFRTLLIDLDPHGSLTAYFGHNPDEIDISVYNLFQDAVAKKMLEPQKYVLDTGFNGLSLMPAATSTATLDRQAGMADGMGLVMRKALSKVQEDYDYVLIDSPPMLGVLMINALAACNHLIVPVLSEFLAQKGLERMVRTLQMINHSRQEKISYTIVPTMFDKRTRSAVETLKSLGSSFPEQLWNSVIPVDTKLRDASRQGIPAPYSHPYTHAVLAYSKLLEELLLSDDNEHPPLQPAVAGARGN